MRVSLVRPCPRLPEKYLKMMGNITPIALLSVGGVLQKSGYKCNLVDAFVNRFSIKETVDKIFEFKPDVLGISSLTPDYNVVMGIVNEIRKRAKIPIVIGGQHATNMVNQVLNSGLFDYIIKGEGEFAFLNLLNALKNGESLDNIKGLVYKKNNGSVIDNKEEIIEDLSILPKRAWNLIDLKNYSPSPASFQEKPAISTMMSRGCPYSCIFCSVNSIFGHKTRQYPLGFVEEEILYLKVNGIKDINLWDSVFTDNKNWAIEVCSIMRKHNIKWNCLSRIDQIGFELLKVMKESGCYEIGYGVESGIQRSLDLMEKDQRIEDVEKTIILTRKAGIKTKCFFIVGFPWETRADIQKTFDFAFKLKPDIVAFSIANAYPGAKLFDQYSDRFTDANYEGMHNLSSTRSISEHIEPDELQRITNKALNKFYLSPSYAWHTLKSCRSFQEILHRFRALCNIFLFN